MSSSFSALVCGALFLALPKCPVCLAAWMGVLGVAGIGALHGWLQVACAGGFVVAIGAFAVNARRPVAGFVGVQSVSPTRRRAVKQCSPPASKSRQLFGRSS